jgi:TorA maturation chaperone TorD
MNTPTNTSIQSSTGFDEETARAEIYGLLSTLYYAAPTPELLAQLRVAVTEAPDSGSFLEAPWSAVIAASRELTDAQIAGEWNSMFGGVGKPEVYLFGSFYLSGFLNEKPLARLRETLIQYGLERDGAMYETEDHIAYVCEVMRYLIAGDDVTVSNLTNQKSFFGDHLQPWVGSMCDTLVANPRAKFYAALAEFTRSFMSVESQGFDLLV